MNTRLLRAVRFIERFQNHFVLAYPQHPSIWRGPAWLSPLFDAWPKAFLLYVLAEQKVSLGDLAPPPRSAFAMHLNQKTLNAKAYLASLLGSDLEITCYRRGRALPAAWCLRPGLLATGHRTSVWRWVSCLMHITRGQDRHNVTRIVEFLVSYADLRRVFRRGRPAFVLADSDLSVRRIAAACAANAESIPVLYWQGHASHTYIPPFQIDAAALTSAKTLAAIRDLGAGPSAPLSLRAAASSARDLVPPRATSDSPATIGVALNAVVEHEALRRMLEAGRRRFANAEFLVRFHPRNKTQPEGLGARVTVAPADETLQAFAERCDIVIASNTGAQIELLGYGAPVIHMAGFESLPFDIYRYVEQDVVFGAGGFDEIDLSAVRTFYRDPGWPERAAAAGLSNSTASGPHPDDPLACWLRRRLSRDSCESTPRPAPAISRSAR